MARSPGMAAIYCRRSFPWIRPGAAKTQCYPKNGCKAYRGGKVYTVVIPARVFALRCKSLFVFNLDSFAPFGTRDAVFRAADDHFCSGKQGCWTTGLGYQEEGRT